MVKLTKILKTGIVDGEIELTEPTETEPGRFVLRLRKFGKKELEVTSDQILTRKSLYAKRLAEALADGFVVV